MAARANRLTAKEIGRELNISPHTVALHLRLARLKMRATSTDQDGKGASHDGAMLEQPAPHREFGSPWVEVAAAAVLFLMTLLTGLMVLGLPLLYYSPYFQHLRH